MAQQTAVEWLYKELYEIPRTLWEDQITKIFEQAKQMEMEKTIMDYNAGYDDAKCNHINDAENYANEIEYIQSRIDKIDNEIKAKQNNIADMLINGMEKYNK
jgi:GTP-binding protein EngB required for normal cell division